jgi:RNA polymerase sigma-70 factor (ECF subfamily)
MAIASFVNLRTSVTDWHCAGIPSIEEPAHKVNIMPLLQRNPRPRSEAHHPLDADATDAVLVAAARHDPRRFEPLFLRYWEPVLRYCTFRLDDRDDAEDAASQVFVDAYASLHRFQARGQEGSFRSWLFTIAHHEIANRHRYRVRHPASRLEEAEDVADPNGTFEQAARADDVAHVLALVRELPDRPREVVELRLAGLTDREIAQVLGISEPAVRQAQSRGCLAPPADGRPA